MKILEKAEQAVVKAEQTVVQEFKTVGQKIGETIAPKPAINQSRKKTPFQYCASHAVGQANPKPQPSRISSALTKAYAPLAAIIAFAKKVLPDIKPTLWGKVPTLPGHDYTILKSLEMPEGSDFEVALAKQGEVIKNARIFQVKRTLALGTVATLLGSAIAHTLRASEKTALVGLGVGLVAGIASWRHYGKVAKIGTIAKNRQKIITNAEAFFGGVSDKTATADYNKIYGEQVGKGLLSKAGAFFRPDIREMRSIVNEIEKSRVAAKH